ncbi:PHD finger protein 14 [Pyxicephalus adspersus]|uniref:PHD finger protein 14 n=1 Tax=Pyxicephalus adspersus TaxID=30357 RepID=UPI003B5B7B71
MDRSSKRHQVKPLATSLLEALDYDSSDDSDFKVGDASDSEGSINGSDDGSKDSEGSGSDSEDSLKENDMAAAAEEGVKDAGGEEESAETQEKPKDEEPVKEESKKEEGEKTRKKKERASDVEITADDQNNEPKKWNLRRNRPMLDFITMEELNAMDDYDSEDDNDWRPTMGKKKGKSSTGDGSDGEDDDDEDDGSDGESSHHGGNKDDSSSSSEDEQKKKKIKIPSRNSGDDEELTNDSLTLSQSKSNEDSLILDKSERWCSQKMDHILICCVCLGDNSEDADEIIQCDNCGITVHEGCYGVDGESDSIMSSASENSTEPWFCDACKCGVTPSCELCPNQDGIFKETDAGRWVHIVCALYVPGVAFGDIDKLRPVTLTEMNYSKYGAKECSFCEDPRFARTGVCISCDAGMCRSYFHVTCAQKEGLLSEAAAEEDIADPFFAYCKQHADRFDRKWKRKNYLALQSYCKMSLKEREKQLIPESQIPVPAWVRRRSEEKARISTRLQQYRVKSELARNTRPQAWVPREKLPRPLTSSASAIRKLMRKAELMGISTDIFPVDTSETSSSVDGRRKHKQPALTADFVTYYLERNMRVMQLQESLSEQKNIKNKLENEQEKLHIEYNKLCEALDDLQNVNGNLRTEGQSLWIMMNKIASQGSKVIGQLTQRLFTNFKLICRNLQCSECDQAGSSDVEADFAMETLPNGTKRSRRQIKEPVKFVSQTLAQDTKKTPLRSTKHCFRGRRKSSLFGHSEDIKKDKTTEEATRQSELHPEHSQPTELMSRTRGQKRKRSFMLEEEKSEDRLPRERRRRQPMTLHKKPKAEDLRTECAACKGTGDNENLVRCDECKLCYHFGCLDPPLKKSPKQTGYGWICQECDSSSSKEDETEKMEARPLQQSGTEIVNID